MKHTLQVTLILIVFYIVAQILGLSLINIDSEVKVVDGKNTLEFSNTMLGERPEMSGFATLIYIVFGVGFGTLLILLIIKFKQFNLWKFWFFLAAFLSMTLALGVIFTEKIALIIALFLSLMKVYRPNILLHNTTELLMYSGIAIFVVPMLEMKWALIMLLAFSAYDAYAVWKSKHMVTMAKFQADSDVFAGLTVPYNLKTIKITKPKKMALGETKGVKTAILGGGDIAFPLLFTGAVMNWLILQGISKSGAFFQSLIVVACSALGLFALFYYADKNKFYPAMPFITAGCLVGLGIVYLI